jgi:hypothetical protein
MKFQYVLLSKILCFITGWISVKARLPKHKNKSVTLGIVCFCICCGYEPHVLIFSPYDNRWIDFKDKNMDMTEFVTHWKSSKTPLLFFDEWMINKRINDAKSL